MAITTKNSILIITLGLATGFFLAEGMYEFKEIDKQEPVVVMIPIVEEKPSYLEYINHWSQQFTLAMETFTSQTSQIEQQPRLYADKKMMDIYSETINHIMDLSVELTSYSLDENSNFQEAHGYFKESAYLYYQAMMTMWNAVTFYQLDANYDIINQTFDKAMEHIKNGMELFQKGTTALH